MKACYGSAERCWLPDGSRSVERNQVFFGARVFWSLSVADVGRQILNPADELSVLIIQMGAVR